MRRFGSDKPDLRFGLELVECTEYFTDTPFRVFQAPYVGAVVMPGGASQPRRTLDGWQDWAKQRGHRGLAYVLVGDDGDARRAGRQEPHPTPNATGWPPMSARRRGTACSSPRVRPSRRAHCWARRASRSRKRLDMIDPNAWAFTWVVDPPLFEPADEATAARRCRGRFRARGRRCITRSPLPSRNSRPPSTPTRAAYWPTPTTSSATATRSAAVRSVSTAAMCRSGCSR